MKALGRNSVASFVTFLLNLASGLVALGIVLALLLVVLSAYVWSPMEVDAGWLSVGSTMSIPVSMTVDASGQHLEAPSLDVQDATLQNVRGLLRFPARRDAFFAANAVLLIASLALAWWVLNQLRAVFRTLRDGHPFVSANAARLRRVAFGVIVSEMARSAIVFFENTYAKMHFTADGLSFVSRLDVNVMAIIGGLIILVIAEVFREGTRLNDEQSLTV